MKFWMSVEIAEHDEILDLRLLLLLLLLSDCDAILDLALPLLLILLSEHKTFGFVCAVAAAV